MKSPNRQDKYPKKRMTYLSRIQKIIPSITQDDLQLKPKLSIRVNTLRSHKTFEDPISWAPNCYWPQGDKNELTHGTEFNNGSIYLQNAASFIPPIVLNPQEGEKILDICAAPGGKASHIAALGNNNIELWVNDNSRPRLLKMQNNLTRLNVNVYKTTLFAINRLTKELPNEYFNKVILDAPCSGEGMMDINSPKDFEHWSVAHIKRLQSLQKQAVLAAWQLLKPGGLLVYSTCTMAPEENEAIIDYLLRKQPNANLKPIKIDLPNRISALKSWNDKKFKNDLSACVRLAPSTNIEAFFVTAVQKNSGYF